MSNFQLGIANEKSFYKLEIQFVEIVFLTINHQPSTINHQPSTINHQPSTINHQPSTINHQSSTIKLLFSRFLFLGSRFLSINHHSQSSTTASKVALVGTVNVPLTINSFSKNQLTKAPDARVTLLLSVMLLSIRRMLEDRVVSI